MTQAFGTRRLAAEIATRVDSTRRKKKTGIKQPNEALTETVERGKGLDTGGCLVQQE